MHSRSRPPKAHRLGKQRRPEIALGEAAVGQVDGAPQREAAQDPGEDPRCRSALRGPRHEGAGGGVQRAGRWAVRVPTAEVKTSGPTKEATVPSTPVVVVKAGGGRTDLDPTYEDRRRRLSGSPSPGRFRWRGPVRRPGRMPAGWCARGRRGDQRNKSGDEYDQNQANLHGSTSWVQATAALPPFIVVDRPAHVADRGLDLRLLVRHRRPADDGLPGPEQVPQARR